MNFNPSVIHRIGLLALVLSTGAAASVDTTARPGGIVPLKPGIYVAKGSTCQDPPNAAIRDYDRRSFSTSSSRACRARVTSRRGTTYRISQSCMDAGTGPAPRTADRFVVSVENALAFKLSRGSATTQYRYCPSYQLPKGIVPRLR
jgi:hypothetical protein